MVHYHLRPGGVARVIEHAAALLEEAGVDVVVLAGPAESEAESAADARLGAVRRIRGLGYDAGHPSITPARLAAALRDRAVEALGRSPDLWHVHNHALGKNAALPGALRELAGRGERMLLQIHDFAEDGRPGNYQRLLRGAAAGDREEEPLAIGRCLYPLADHVHYATLNRRDARFLAAAGVPADRLHDLPNAVRLPDADAGGIATAPIGSGRGSGAETPRRADRLYLFPTRAIRRKNLGEFMLWAALGEAGDRFATTLAPKNPEHQPIYQRWVSFARRLGLSVDFEVGGGSHRAFAGLLRKADQVVTTSVAEGFGLTFLEPWLAGRPLLGRDLPDITADFKEAGVDLGALYNRLDVPLEWIGENTFRHRLAAVFTETCQAYGRSRRAGDVERAFRAAVHEGRVDFGRLDETMQRGVIQRLARSAPARTEIHPPSLSSPPIDSGGVVRRNQRIVRQRFSGKEYRRRLLAAYRKVLASPTGPVDALPPDRVLDQFLSPERFCLLRS